ncbi:uncharacterized protein LOC143371648 [Andrena cerasifolii]|uniref:uncharacterized protein LOC143371648 n=1 Tax=Andrena cerasifolii TaxID=2819439 RepID=UPI004037BDB5
MRMLGIAREGINVFCGLMDLGQGLSKSCYDDIVKLLYDTAKTAFDILCKKAVEEEKKKNEENGRPASSFKVSGDGSWKKRGFSSLFGVITLIGYYSGKVIDIVVKGSYCQACTYWEKKKDNDDYKLWLEDHADECSINHHGSAGKMEVISMVEMFSRSEEKFGVKYLNYIGDGDAKTFKAIVDMQPYGDDFDVKKSECVGHVEKRMGSRLRSVEKSAKLGGRGKLTEVLTKKLTKYYGLAIRRNHESVEEMQKAVMATFYYMISTGENPQHQNCPTGTNSWCKWRVAEAAGTIGSYEHLPALHPDVQEHILPIYEDLSRVDLLERCLGGHTQNANESFNATIWRLAPKHLNCGFKIVEIASFLAAGTFNEGYSFVLQLMQALDLIIGRECKMFAHEHDAQRLKRQERRSLSSIREERTTRGEQNAALLEEFEEEEGLMYGPGIAD